LNAYTDEQIQRRKRAKGTTRGKRAWRADHEIDRQLDGGGYEVRPAADNRIRVTSSGNTGNATIEIMTNATHADVKVKDTPRSNFHATIEVPEVSDLVIRLAGGELVMAAVTGNKDVESNGGDIKIAVGDPNDYSSVDASVKAGDIDAGVFGGAKSGALSTLHVVGTGQVHASCQFGRRQSGVAQQIETAHSPRPGGT
jgi:hypothetical protein